jgi:hypothetical protein
MPRQPIRPRNYFLNESHELSPEEKGGGGRFVSYLGVNWKNKSQRLHQSLQKIERRTQQSIDPLKGRKYYILADPEPQVVKQSTAKDAEKGQKVEEINFGGEQSKLFERLGLDLIEVHSSGAATVHASPERMQQLLTKTSTLPNLGAREQARFVAIEQFEWIPSELKFDAVWLGSIAKQPVESYVKLQPLVTELEADLVIRAIEEIARVERGLSIKGRGQTYLGRFFIRAEADARSIKKLAEGFSSIQSIHPPIIAFTQSLPPDIGGSQPIHAGSTAISVAQLPIVGVLDTAIPPQHPALSPYRSGVILGLNCLNTENDHHGSFVASRVVYGDIPDSTSPLPPPECRFLEVRVGSREPGRGKILVDSVPGALATAVMTAPDARVFNLSFDGAQPLHSLPARYRAETLKLIEEIDNFAFDQDVLIVTAAGNVRAGVVPVPPYPHHLSDDNWQLHTIPRAVNTLTCGGFVSRLTADGLAPELYAPSPFTRLGPGFAKSPKPDFSAPAGDADSTHHPQVGSGVFGVTALGGIAEDFGTSFAAPLLAREGAKLLHHLRSFAPDDSRPFACTAKAILTISAKDVVNDLDAALHPLARRALGHGVAKSEYFSRATQAKARFVWQGVIPREDEMARIQMPIPVDWVQSARSPRIEICVAWDSPVSSAAIDKWTCRDVGLTVRSSPDGDSIPGAGKRVAGYPLYKRGWDLKACLKDKMIRNDAWTLELKFSQTAAYAAGHIVPAWQRVAFAAEIWDDDENPLPPHSFVQGLPIATTLSRLSNNAMLLRQPIAVASQF